MGQAGVDLNAEVEVPYKNKKIRVPLSKALEWASKAHAADQKFKEAQEQISQFKAESEAYGDFVEYRKYMVENPQIATFVAQALQSYHESGEVPGMHDTSDYPADGLRRPRVTPSSDRKTQELEMRLARAEARFQSMDQQQQTQQLANQLTDLVMGDPVLRAVHEASVRAGNSSLAFEKLLSMVESDPGGDLEVMARAAATDFAPLVSQKTLVDPRDQQTADSASTAPGATPQQPTQQQQYDALRQAVMAATPQTQPVQEADQFRSVSPEAEAVAPPPGNQKSFKAEDLKSGKVGASAAAFLRQLQR